MNVPQLTDFSETQWSTLSVLIGTTIIIVNIQEYQTGIFSPQSNCHFQQQVNVTVYYLSGQRKLASRDNIAYVKQE